MRRWPVLILTCCLLIPSPARGWWEKGHQVVARIAAAHLSPAARTRIAHLLDVEDTPEAVATALARASLWADETKKENNTGGWHYIDLALQDSKADIALRCERDNCVTARTRLFSAQLASQNSAAAAPWSDLDALRYLVHFVGDIHQPLHDVSDADQGGNCEALVPPVIDAKNLHALWDGELVNILGSSDQAIAAELEAEIKALPADRQAQLAAGNQDDWVWEGHLLAQKEIYDRLGIPREPVLFPAKCSEAPAEISGLKLEIDPKYMEAMKPVVRLQLERAGLRLAHLLNQTSDQQMLP